MSLERSPSSLLQAPSEDEEGVKAQEQGKEARGREFEVHLIDFVLREEISRKFSGKFEHNVKEIPKDLRTEALLDFKASYLKHQLNLAAAITETKKLIQDNPDFTVTDLMARVDLSILENQEQSQVLEVTRRYEQQAKELKVLLRSFWPDKVYEEHRKWDDGKDGRERGWVVTHGAEITDPIARKRARQLRAKEELFFYLTGQKNPWLNLRKLSVERRGNNLICYAEPKEFRELYAGNATGEERRSMLSQASAVAGFHRVEKRKHPTDGHEITFHTIGINRGFEQWGDVLHYHPDQLDRTRSHELQHALDSNLELDRGNVELDFPFREDLEKHLSTYVAGYLDSLRDEAIAHVIEGHGQSLAKADYTSREAFYFYPAAEPLIHYRKLLGEERFQEWKVEEIWEEKVVKPFRSAADDIARISARLASTPKQQRDKLAALFEIEPAEKWQRLERWLDDPEVKRSVGRGLPKLALLPKKHQKLV